MFSYTHDKFIPFQILATLYIIAGTPNLSSDLAKKNVFRFLLFTYDFFFEYNIHYKDVYILKRRLSRAESLMELYSKKRFSDTISHFY